MNHVHKRMGTALRKVVKETTSEYQTKSGETKHRKLLGGRGKLTEDIIVKLSDYYGYAIKRNVGKTVEDNAERHHVHLLPLHIHGSEANAFLVPKRGKELVFLPEPLKLMRRRKRRSR